MKKPPANPPPGAQELDNHNHREDLRRRAEEALRGQLAQAGSLSGDEVQRLIHELQIHQVELEMQNETLRQTQADLEAARDRYHALFELAPVGYLLLSPAGKIVEANLAAGNLLEVELARLKQTSLTDYIIREDQDIYYLGVQRVHQHKVCQEFELGMLTSAGSRVDVVLQCTREEEHGEPTGQMRVTLSDITGRKQQARELEAYARRLEILNINLEEFAFVVSHDMKEPLHKINRFGQLLLEHSPQLEEQGRDYLQRMINATTRMGTLIDALLSLARLKTPTSGLQAVDLNQVVRSVLAELNLRILETGAQVEVGPLPSLRAEPTQMQQLFMNLIGNAIKFHQPDLPPHIQVTATRAPGGQVEIQVADNGIGFDQESVSTLFKPFSRLHGRSKYEGTGIGLAICRRIVDNHAGQITARSALGQGATFIVTLPDQPPGTSGF